MSEPGRGITGVKSFNAMSEAEKRSEAPALEWTPMVEVFRTELQRHFSDHLSMEEISEFSYSMAAKFNERAPDRSIWASPIDVAKMDKLNAGLHEQAIEQAVMAQCSSLQSGADLDAVMQERGPEREPTVWKSGNRVCFAHSPTVFHVDTVFTGEEPNVQLRELPGLFASHIFVAAPPEPVPAKLPYKTPVLSGPFTIPQLKALKEGIAVLTKLINEPEIAGPLRVSDGGTTSFLIAYDNGALVCEVCKADFEFAGGRDDRPSFCPVCGRKNCAVQTW